LNNKRETERKEVKKMKMKFRTLILIGILALVWAGSALARSFVNDPETYAPEWSTSFPYQRNIYLDFSVDPTYGLPIPLPGPIPGADYEGYDDPLLWDSDYVQFVGDVEWDPFLGVIGIDNAFGIDPLFGAAIFHIDNWLDNPLKHIWLEIETIQMPFLPPWGMIAPSLELPGGYDETGFWLGPIEDLGGDRYRQNDWWEVKPNPPWENVVINFTALPGQTVYLDSFHVATECIPEPSTILLLGCGALGLFGIIIRNRRKQKNNSD